MCILGSTGSRCAFDGENEVFAACLNCGRVWVSAYLREGGFAAQDKACEDMESRAHLTACRQEANP